MKNTIGSLVIKRAVGPLACAVLAVSGAACGNEAPGGASDEDVSTIIPDAGIIDDIPDELPEDPCDGKDFLSDTQDEPAGKNCKWGGSKTIMGLDENCDRVLEESEVLHTTYECIQSEYVDPYTYTLSNLTDRSVVMDLRDSYDIQLQVTNQKGEPLAGAKVVLTIQNKLKEALSFKRNSLSYSASLTADEDGMVEVTIYSNHKEASGTLNAMVLSDADGNAIECNSVTISVRVKDQSEENNNDSDETDAGTELPPDSGTNDDNPGNTEVTGKGKVTVKVKNESDAAKAEINVYYVDGNDTTPYCDQLRSGKNIGDLSNSSTMAISKGSTGSKTFKSIPAGKKVVAHAIGLTKGGKQEGIDDCTISNVVKKDSSETLNLTITPKADINVNLDQSYDTLLHLDLTSIFPASWKKWFDLVDGLFQSPVGTAIYYALYYWEYHGDYAETGGGSQITYNTDNLLGLGVPLAIDINIWDSIIADNKPTDPTVAEVMEVCGLTDNNNQATEDCPSLSVPITVSGFQLNIGPWQLFPMAVNAAEEALNNIDGFGNVYENIKRVGIDLTSMAKRFDIGSRFSLKQITETSVEVTETWSHVVWTWKLGDESAECTPNSSSYDLQKCGRHALNFAKNDLKSSAVNETYVAAIDGSTKPGATSVKLMLTDEHAFTLKYGALLETFLNRVVIPQVMNRDKDGLNSDGESFTQPVSSDTDLGDLLNYWIPCTKVSEAVYNKIMDLLNGSGQTTDEQGNPTGGFNLGNLIQSFITKETLDGYCTQGLNVAADYAIDKLETLVADANLKVRKGSTFTVTEIDKEQIPQTLNDLNYKVGMTVDKVDDNGNTTQTQNFDATIKGEGIRATNTPPTTQQCEKFMHLTYDAAAEACPQN